MKFSVCPQDITKQTNEEDGSLADFHSLGRWVPTDSLGPIEHTMTFEPPQGDPDRMSAHRQEVSDGQSRAT